MGYLMTATDIVELAMQLEKSGEVFYREVARKATSPEMKVLFEDLAEQEVKHYKVFAQLARTLGDGPPIAEDWEEYMGYVNAAVQGAFFEGPDKALAAAKEVKGQNEAVRTAIGFEKETLLFFYGLRDSVYGADRPVIDKVVTEEKSHIRRLAGML